MSSSFYLNSIFETSFSPSSLCVRWVNAGLLQKGGGSAYNARLPCRLRHDICQDPPPHLSHAEFRPSLSLSRAYRARPYFTHRSSSPRHFRGQTKSVRLRRGQIESDRFFLDKHYKVLENRPQPINQTTCLLPNAPPLPRPPYALSTRRLLNLASISTAFTFPI